MSWRCCASGHPISDELTDSMQSHMTKLEVENDQLKSELEEIKTKLQETQQQLERVIDQSEKDYEKRRKEFEKEQAKMRQRITNDVTARVKSDYDAKFKAAQDLSKKEKRQIVEDYDAKITLLEKEISELKLQLEKWTMKDEDSKTSHSTEVLSDLQDQLKKYQQENFDLRAKNDRNQKLSKMRSEFTGRDISNNDPISNKSSEAMTEFHVNNMLEQKLRHVENELQRELGLLQQEKEDLQLEFEALQEDLALEREKYDTAVADFEKSERENRELKENIETVRECSENHIRSLELDLANLQTKAVAMESLNEYLSNLSSAEDGMSLPNDEKYEDSHDVSRDSLRSLPADLRQLRSRYEPRNANDADNTYAEICSLNMSQQHRSHRTEKINYVKSGIAQKEVKQLEQAQRSGGLFDKLRNYVKPQKENEARKSSKSTTSCVPRKATCDVAALREKPPTFDRNSRYRHTIQNIKMKETKQPEHTTRLKTPMTYAQSKPATFAFSRDHALRKTMPERRTVYKFPEKRSRDRLTLSRDQLAKSRDGSQYSLAATAGSQNNCHDISNDDVNKRKFSVPPNPYHAHCFDHSDGGTTDSGLAHSAENSPPNKHQSAELESNFHCSTPQQSRHCLTSIEILNTESVTKHFVSSPAGNSSLIEQIVKLQDKNIGLSSENEKLKKSIDATSDGNILQRLQQLEAENRKLKIIIETYAQSGKIPYDKREYHFFTNV